MGMEHRPPRTKRAEPEAGPAHLLLAGLGLARVSTVLSTGVKHVQAILRETGRNGSRRGGRGAHGTDSCGVQAGLPMGRSRSSLPECSVPGAGRRPDLPCSPALEAVSSGVPGRKAAGASVTHSAPADAGGKPPLGPRAFLQPRPVTGRPQASAPSGGSRWSPCRVPLTPLCSWCNSEGRPEPPWLGKAGLSSTSNWPRTDAGLRPAPLQTPGPPPSSRPARPVHQISFFP